MDRIVPPPLTASQGVAVVALADLVADDPHLKWALYHRCSGRQQAGKRKAKLKLKTEAVIKDATLAHPLKEPAEVFADVEEGKLSKPRPKLIEAAQFAKRDCLVLVAVDLSRFIRAESYDRRTSCHAWPTPEEFATLREMTLGVQLATILPPDLTESERHSRATKRTGRAGRPKRLTIAQAAVVFDLLGGCIQTWDGRWRWQSPISEVAEFLGISAATIYRMADQPSTTPGFTWRQLAIKKAEGWRIVPPYRTKAYRDDPMFCFEWTDEDARRRWFDQLNKRKGEVF